MTPRKKVRIIQKFAYANGSGTGTLDTIVFKFAQERQLAANAAWLARKGHTLISTSIEEVESWVKS